MALGDLMASRLVHSSSAAPSAALPNHHTNHVVDEQLPVENGPEPRRDVADEEPPAPVALLPQVVVLCEQRHESFDEAASPVAGPSTSGLVSKWRPKDRMKTGCVALVLCLNISVDPPDVIKISPCARKECWIDPFSMAPPKALETIGKTMPKWPYTIKEIVDVLEINLPKYLPTLVRLLIKFIEDFDLGKFCCWPRDGNCDCLAVQLNTVSNGQHAKLLKFGYTKLVLRLITKKMKAATNPRRQVLKVR